MGAPVRIKFPPEEFTEDEAAAIAGRFVMAPEAKPAPAFKGREGRAPAAPHGVVWVRGEGDTGPEEEEDEDEEEEAAEDEDGGIDLESWTVTELKGALDQVGIEYPANARKQELIELIEEAELEIEQ